MFDLLIVGSGVAGLSAAVYARRFGLSAIVVGDLPGGTITKTHLVENYPGFTSLTGYELAKNILDHAKSVETEIKTGAIEAISREENKFVATLKNGETLEARSVLLATGTAHRHLDIPGEKEFENRGVSFCATCDAPFFKDKTVAVIGGSDSAVKESLVLAEHAAKVFIIYRRGRENLRAEPINIERAEKNEKIEFVFNKNLTEILGSETVEKIKLDDGSEMPLDGVFVEIGRIPKTELAKNIGVKLSENGEIVIDKKSRTNIDGVFAAGDCTNSDWKQAITAAAEGAHAANSTFEYLTKNAK